MPLVTSEKFAPASLETWTSRVLPVPRCSVHTGRTLPTTVPVDRMGDVPPLMHDILSCSISTHHEVAVEPMRFAFQTSSLPGLRSGMVVFEVTASQWVPLSALIQ